MVCSDHDKRLLTVFILSPVSPGLPTSRSCKTESAGLIDKHRHIMPFYFFFMIIIFVLDSGCTDNKGEVKSRLPVIYPSYLYLTVPPKKVHISVRVKLINDNCLLKDVMFNCKVKSATNLNISWSFNNKSLQPTTNRRF